MDDDDRPEPNLILAPNANHVFIYFIIIIFIYATPKTSP